jgi:hypothetical protein
LVVDNENGKDSSSRKTDRHPTPWELIAHGPERIGIFWKVLSITYPKEADSWLIRGSFRMLPPPFAKLLMNMKRIDELFHGMSKNIGFSDINLILVLRVDTGKAPPKG